MHRKVAYVFLYKNGIRERSVGIVRRYGTAEQPEVALELFGEERRKKWRIFYLTKEEALCEAAYLWEATGVYGRNETRRSQCRLCAEAGRGAGVVLLPLITEQVAEKDSTEQHDQAELTGTNLREYLCARYDGQELTEEQLREAMERKPTEEVPENPCIESAKKLMEEITRAAGGDGTERERSEGNRSSDAYGNRVPEKKGQRRSRKQMTHLEELLFLKSPYIPCRRYDVEYSVRIVPEDLLLLSKEGKRYAENSFVLHGYYRYRHILLGRRRAKEKEHYVLLIPGVYGEREVRLAERFGFPEFLPVALKKPETDSAASGTEVFGYFCGKI